MISWVFKNTALLAVRRGSFVSLSVISRQYVGKKKKLSLLFPLKSKSGVLTLLCDWYIFGGRKKSITSLHLNDIVCLFLPFFHCGLVSKLLPSHFLLSVWSGRRQSALLFIYTSIYFMAENNYFRPFNLYNSFFEVAKYFSRNGQAIKNDGSILRNELTAMMLSICVLCCSVCPTNFAIPLLFMAFRECRACIFFSFQINESV